MLQQTQLSQLSQQLREIKAQRDDTLSTVAGGEGGAERKYVRRESREPGIDATREYVSSDFWICRVH